MRRVSLAVLALAVVAATVALSWQGRRAQPVEMPPAAAFRILLGMGDAEPTVWDGKITASGARILSIQGWRFAETDSSDYRTSWKAQSRRGQATAAAQAAGRLAPVVENGVIVTARLEDGQARFALETAQGNFAFAAAELPFGTVRPYLKNRVLVERVPSSVQLTVSDEEQDYPAVAQSGDDVYVSFVEFTHGDRSAVVQGQFREEPKSFDFLARPAGGDQVLLQHYSKSRRVWSPSMEVSAPGQDVMRTAVAVDGSKRAWVVWSANRGGNFDLYAKSYQGGKWSAEMRLTTDRGADLNPEAGTDAGGRVWLAWQAFRNGNLEILAAVQDGERFAREETVSTSPASDWDPSLAAAGNGEVAVSWDTYDKGDYDVYFRRMRWDGRVRMDAPAAVAASPNFEARSAAAYDPQNRLWVAYEASDVKWGKDFGAYESTGIALYQGHNLRVKCFEGNQAFATADELAAALPGFPGVAARRRRAPQIAALSPMQPNPELARKRAPNAATQAPPLPLNSFPRLAVDAAGTVFLAFRSATTASRSPVGTVWGEHVVWFDGARWNGPVPFPKSDNLLDNRPGLLSFAPGHLLMVASADHRQQVVAGGGRRGASGVNNDLYAAEMELAAKPQPAQLQALPAETPAAPDAEIKAELEQVAFIRNYRARLGGDNPRLLRGEFHRHTEISGDGGRDGPLIDAYRYFIDAAYMDWGGTGDHDNGNGREYSWWIQQKLVEAYTLGEKFVPMFTYERSVRYPEGHRNVVFAQRGVRPLPRLPKVADDAPFAPAPDTQMLYRYLKRFSGVAASHTSGTNMGTDWRDNDPLVEPVVEIYQGHRQNYEMPDAPRSNSANDSIGGWRPLGFVSLALQKGYRLGFQASSDHISTHTSYCNLWVTAPTREAILEAFRKRRVYGATDNILADVRCGAHFMGEEFATAEPPALAVKLWGTADFAKVHIIKDGAYAYSIEPKARKVDFLWKDAAAVRGKTSYYYVRGEQADGELVWVSPMWITYK
ncbi:MAG: hypothetical protein FJW34_04930 [Acidobacteria bacterium]|nr:hypothetical protein [Acidobacteriota bacterium]